MAVRFVRKGLAMEKFTVFDTGKRPEFVRSAAGRQEDYLGIVGPKCCLLIPRSRRIARKRAVWSDRRGQIR